MIKKYILTTSLMLSFMASASHKDNIYQKSPYKVAMGNFNPRMITDIEMKLIKYNDMRGNGFKAKFNRIMNYPYIDYVKQIIFTYDGNIKYILCQVSEKRSHDEYVTTFKNKVVDAIRDGKLIYIQSKPVACGDKEKISIYK